MRDLIALASLSSLSVFAPQDGTRRCQGDLAGGDLVMTAELEAGVNDLELLLRDSARGIDRFCSVFRDAAKSSLTGECGIISLGEVRTQVARVTGTKSLSVAWHDAANAPHVVTLKPIEGGDYAIELKLEPKKTLTGKLACRVR